MHILYPPGYSKTNNRDLLPYWVDVQADLSLCWSHRSYFRFCCSLAHISLLYEEIPPRNYIFYPAEITKISSDIWYDRVRDKKYTYMEGEGSCDTRSTLSMCALFDVWLLSIPHHLERCLFCLAFYCKWKYFVLTDHFVSGTVCLFCSCTLFSNIYYKISFTAKNWSDLAISIVNWIFFLFFFYHKVYFAFLHSF